MTRKWRARTRASIVVATAAAAVSLGPPATASAAPDWGCTASPLTASLLAAELPLGLLRANPSDVPCGDDHATLVDLTPVVGLSATVADAETDTTGGALPDRVLTARAEVEDLGLEPLGFGGLLGVGLARASATARCTPAGAPQLTATSTFDDVTVLGLPVDVQDQPLDIDVGVVRARFVPHFEQRTATRLRRVALRVEITALLGGAQLLVADIGEAAVSAVDLPCAAAPPTVTMVPGAGNRQVVAQVTRASGAATDAVTDCEISVRAQGSGAAFAPVPTTFDAATGRCSATLRAGTYQPGGYEVRATAVDVGGDGGQATTRVTVVAPRVGRPVLDGGTIVVPVTPAPGTPIATCTVTLSPVGGGPGVVLEGSYDAAAGVCRARMPGGARAGRHTVTVVVTDVNGDRGTGSGALDVPSKAADPRSGGADAPQPRFGDGSANDLALACTDRRLVLTELARRGRWVTIAGAAEGRYHGRRVAIVYQATRKVVARPRVGADGRFRARVRAPRGALGRSNRARYVARAGRDRSLPLKLRRRMARASVTRSGGFVTVRGTVSAPLARPRQAVVLQRMVGCGRYVAVRRARLGRGGRYRIRVPAPEGVRSAVYRAQTRVASRPGGPARSMTFTLPLPVALD